MKAIDPSYALLSAGPTKYGGTQLPDAEGVSAIEGLRPGMTLLRTDVHDTGCPEPDRVGADDDAPGGCDNYVLDVGP